MLYPTAPMPRDVPALPGDVAGYFANTGGLNNQKLALLGVFLDGIATSRPIVLPYFTVLGGPPEGGRLIRLFDVYEQAPLLHLADACGLRVVQAEPTGGSDGWDHFRIGSDYFGNLGRTGTPRPNDFGFVFLRSLVPRLRSSPLSTELAEHVFGQRGVRVVAQLRIESDWVSFAQETLDGFGDTSADHAPSAVAILGKIHATLPDTGRSIYVTVNEDDMPAPKETIRADVQRLFGIELIWKSDVIAPVYMGALNRTDLAVLDFEMALRAEYFVGTSNSTFANVVAMETFAARGQPVRGHYLWNLAGPVLRERTDEGLTIHPAEATDPNRPRFAPAPEATPPPSEGPVAAAEPATPPVRHASPAAQAGGGVSLWSTFLGHRGREIDKWKHYFPAYEAHLRRYVNRPAVLIEIGVGEGGSAEMWRRYLGPFAQIVGIDNNPTTADAAGPQVAIRIGDQTDADFLAAVIAEFGVPDIVIDDASHQAADMVASFRALYPRLAPDGVYIVEDLHAAYWDEYGGGLRREGTFIELCKQLIDELNADWTRGALAPTDFSRSTLSMHLYDSLAVFQRGRPAQDGDRQRRS